MPEGTEQPRAARRDPWREIRLYVESSALLAAVLDEPAGEAARTQIAAAEILITSELTLIECDRALHRAVALKKLSEPDAAERRALVALSTSAWVLIGISDQVVDRARQPFPADSVRALDAIHLASALVARSGTPGLEILTLDDRVRSAARALGFSIQPAGDV